MQALVIVLAISNLGLIAALAFVGWRQLRRDVRAAERRVSRVVKESRVYLSEQVEKVKRHLRD